jgi:hypothetical protein
MISEELLLLIDPDLNYAGNSLFKEVEERASLNEVDFL